MARPLPTTMCKCGHPAATHSKDVGCWEQKGHAVGDPRPCHCTKFRPAVPR